MPQFTILVGVVLTALGAWAYYTSDGASITAAIPAFFGIPFLILGFLGRNEKNLKMTMHIAAVLALLGLAGAARGIPDAITMMQGGEVERPTAAIVQTVMAIVCGGFLGAAIKSFIDVRRAKG